MAANLNGDNAASSWDEARQLGQLFMMGFDGTAVNDQVRVLIEKYHVGSILLTAKNLKSAEQTRQLVTDLQRIAHDAGHVVPLLIAIDQENGGVNSLFDEVYIRQFPSAMGMAATGSKSLTKHVARATAQELALCGINWIMGPVMDVLTNARSQPLGVRSFGDDPQEVSAYATECLKGYQEGGLATCGKHFPSYGNLEFFGAPNDVPTITDSLEHLSQTALIPFRNSIAQGIDAMMVGGVALSSSSLNVMHACLSEQVVRDLLRNELHFDGVVVSECLEMEALSRNIGISGGTVMAFNAGCDVMLTCRNLSVQEEAINGLKAGLDNGMIERFRVQESLQRILNLKHRYTSWDTVFSTTGIEQLSRLQQLHTKLSTTAYAKSITIVRDQKQYLPLSKVLRQDEELLLLTPLVKPLPASAAHHQNQKGPFSPEWDFQSSHKHNANSPLDSSVMNGETVFRALGRSLGSQRKGKVSHTSYNANGLRPIHENLLSRASAVIIVTADAGRNMYQSGFTKHVSMLCKVATGPDGTPREIPCVVVAVSSPFDFASDNSIGTYVCTYDFTETALQALVKVLYGEQSSAGTLPGSFHQAPKTIQAKQQWLVEAFNEERDISTLNDLLAAVANGKGDSNLTGVTAKTFLLRNTEVDEAHFVVRNSTTKELFGFCATYFLKSTMTGHIATIIVDPKRRNLSIGRSLHDRAIRALLQKKGIQQFRLGARLPIVFPGIPKNDSNENKALRKWFTNAGWKMTNIRTVHSLVINDLASWSPPDGLGQALKITDVKYELVQGSEHYALVMSHVEKHSDPITQAMYKTALVNQESCAIIRAKRITDGHTLATVLLFKSSSRLAAYIPATQLKGAAIGGLSCAVVAGEVDDKLTLVQGLILLGTRQLKKQSIQRVLMEYVDDNSIIEIIKAVGFVIWRSYEEITSKPSAWTMMMPPT